jgi:hypothetical protein
MASNNKNGNPYKIKFYFLPSFGGEHEVSGMSNEIFESVLVRFSKEFPDVKFREAIYKGNLIDNSLTLSENKIEEDARILLPEVNDFDNDNVEINIKKNKEDFEFNPFMDLMYDLENMRNFEKSQSMLYESIRLNNCSSKNNNREEVKSNEAQIKTTNHNHGLVYLLSNKSWTCKICNSNFTEKEPTYYCSLCDYNICKYCMGANHKYNLTPISHEQTLLKTHKFPFHEHPLIYCRTSRFEDKQTAWCCDICDKGYSDKIWSFYCTVCDYDLCLKCSKRYIPDDEFIISHGIKVDKHEHPLVFMKTNRLWTCSQCSKSNDIFEPSFCCTKCDYDICEKCMKNLSDEEKYPFFGDGERKDYNIKKINEDCHEHPLMYCLTSRTKIAMNWNCNLCNKHFGMDDWSFYCSVCDYDLCFDCYRKFYEL